MTFKTLCVTDNDQPPSLNATINECGQVQYHATIPVMNPAFLSALDDTPNTVPLVVEPLGYRVFIFESNLSRNMNLVQVPVTESPGVVVNATGIKVQLSGVYDLLLASRGVSASRSNALQCEVVRQRNGENLVVRKVSVYPQSRLISVSGLFEFKCDDVIFFRIYNVTNESAQLVFGTEDQGNVNVFTAKVFRIY